MVDLTPISSVGFQTSRPIENTFTFFSEYTYILYLHLKLQSILITKNVIPSSFFARLSSVNMHSSDHEIDCRNSDVLDSVAKFESNI